MTRVIVVGGGASGLAAAIVASKGKSNVMILERNNCLGKKILITGNGKCNYWNENQSVNYYHSYNKELLEEVITLNNQKKVLDFFEHLGVIPRIKNGYYYPYSNQAVAVKMALVNEINSSNIKVVTETFVKEIKREDDKFLVITNNENFVADKVIIATGSCAAPQTGSDGNGYLLAESLGHKLIPVLPSLTQIYGSNSYYKEWNGIRLNALVSLYEEDEKIREEKGEIHLTSYGISGICTFNLSGLVAKGLAKKKKEVIYINFVDELGISNKKDLVRWLDERNEKLGNRKVDKLFDGFINYKLINLFLKIGNIDKDWFWNDLKEEQKLCLANMLVNFKFNVLKVNDFSSAQVCSGGVALTEINIKTMESLKVKNLYFTGEILDIDGDCGGYNLSFAWISGILAGEAVREDNA